MCGGVSYKIKKISEDELKKYYSKELIARFKKTGRVESFFWHDKASLPVNTGHGIQLKLWGNKEKENKFPKTGWARIESLNTGKWDYLSPKFVDIPIDAGYEKKVWFDTPEGTKGVLVKTGDDERVYMVTTEAGSEYNKETGHDREAPGLKRNYKKSI